MTDEQVSTEKVMATITTLIPVELRQRGVAVKGVVLPHVAELIHSMTKAQADYLLWGYVHDGEYAYLPESAAQGLLSPRQRSLLRRIGLGRRAGGRGAPDVDGLMIPSWKRVVGGVLLRTERGLLPTLIPGIDVLRDSTLRVVLL